MRKCINKCINKLKQETDSELSETNILEYAIRIKKAMCKYFVQSL